MHSAKQRRQYDDIPRLVRTFDAYVAKTLTPSEKTVALKARTMGSSALSWYDTLLVRP